MKKTIFLLIFALLLSVPCHAVADEGTAEDIISIDTHIHTEMCDHSTEMTVDGVTVPTGPLNESEYNAFYESLSEARRAREAAEAEEEALNARLALLRKIGYANVYITEYNGKKVVGAEVTLDNVHLISNAEARATITQALNNASLNSTSSCSHEWMDIVIGDEHPHETPQMCMLCGASQTIYLFDLWHQDSTPSATHTSQGHAYTRECTFRTCTYSETLYMTFDDGSCQGCIDDCYDEYGHTFIGPEGYYDEHPHYYFSRCSLCGFDEVLGGTYNGVYPGCVTCNTPVCTSHTYGSWRVPSSTHSSSGHAQTRSCTQCGEIDTAYVSHYDDCADCTHTFSGVWYTEAMHTQDYGHLIYESCIIGSCSVRQTHGYAIDSYCCDCGYHTYPEGWTVSSNHVNNNGHLKYKECIYCGTLQSGGYTIDDACSKCNLEDGIYYIRSIAITDNYIEASSAETLYVKPYGGIVEYNNPKRFTITTYNNGTCSLRLDLNDQYLTCSSSGALTYSASLTSSSYWRVEKTDSGNFKIVNSQYPQRAFCVTDNASGDDPVSLNAYTDNSVYTDEWAFQKVSFRYYVEHYYDIGYAIRFSTTSQSALSKLQTYNDIVSEKYLRLFGLELIADYYDFESQADICKDLSGGLSEETLATPCNHPWDHLTGERIRNEVSGGSDYITVVIWTGHILTNDETSSSHNLARKVVITPNWTTDPNENYENESDDVVLRESVDTFMHELAHQLGAPDHYCYDPYDTSSGDCPNPNCYECKYEQSPPDCLMTSHIGVINVSNEDIFCDNCIAQIFAYLNANLRI